MQLEAFDSGALDEFSLPAASLVASLVDAISLSGIAVLNQTSPILNLIALEGN